jgi:hypothetical protein
MNQRPVRNSAFRNYARLEVERMNWDEYLDDPVGDERRRLQSELHQWRAWAVCSLITNVVLVFLLLGGGQ